MTPRKCLSSQQLERIAKIIGDTNEGLTGSQIGHALTQYGLKDVDPTNTKWKRLFNAFADYQEQNKCSNYILLFLQNVVNPQSYSDANKFEETRLQINEILSYAGYELQPNGKYHEIKEANTITEAQSRANKLLADLKARNAHSDIFKYCTAELVDKNYFHAVFEACKGLFERIRQLSFMQADGVKLVSYVFNHPVLIINEYKTQQQKDEQKGFEAILEGICKMFRNPEAHCPKIEWPMEEQDALEILSLISYCHRRLDKAQRVTE
jgi:uncharacterized protein (TIGR02391 family)